MCLKEQERKVYSGRTYRVDVLLKMKANKGGHRNQMEQKEEDRKDKEKSSPR
jgi:hypothetical protein